eukprot:TRINITY_DN969_c0_g1_i5.p1 TRINITY_DN969_c0_g1~~TRINITY_DN969_c0_g1_i5.p1  ORF type:complete len:551 (-),score=103.97 TRINITY_DN969_c0_g1_i5:611-2263(-)
MNNWEYASLLPTSPWRGGMTLSRTLSLRPSTGQSAYVLAQEFVPELANYRETYSKILSNQTVSANGPNLLAGLSSTQFEIIAEFLQGSDTTATEYGFRVRVGGGCFTTVAYSRTSGTILVDRRKSGDVDFYSGFANVASQQVSPIADGRVQLHVLVDWSSVELLANDGIACITENIFPPSSSTGIELYALDGTVTLLMLEFHPISSGARPDVPELEFRTNAGPFTAITGVWQANNEGLVADSELLGDVFACGGITTSSKGTYTGTLRIGTAGAAALVFLANKNLTAGFAANIDSISGCVKLWKLGSGVVLGEYRTTILTQYAYRIAVVFGGGSVSVFFGGGTAPVFNVSGAGGAGEYLGLNAWNGKVVFQDVEYSVSAVLPNPGYNSNAAAPWTPVGGTWAETAVGMRGTTPAGADVFLLSASQTTVSFVYEADLVVGTEGGAAALCFRFTAEADAGYCASIDQRADVVKLWRRADSAVLGTYSTEIGIRLHHLKVVAAGNAIDVYVDDKAEAVVHATDNTRAQDGFAGLNAFNGTAVFQNVYFHGANNN